LVKFVVKIRIYEKSRRLKIRPKGGGKRKVNRPISLEKESFLKRGKG